MRSFSVAQRLYLERDELDNLQKSKYRRSFPVNFAVELLFEPCTQAEGGVGEECHSELVD